MKAYELLAKPEAWTKGDYARDFRGAFCGDSEAVSWCASGAIWRCYRYAAPELPPSAVFEAHDRLSAAVRGSIAAWNDSRSRTHAEVVAVLKEFDI